jgi:CHAT domain-containing protein/tetratricopeptide (TPR) repeat protein
MDLSRSWRAEDKREAISSFQSLLDLAAERGDTELERLSSQKLGDLHRKLGRDEEALRFYRRALRSGSDLGAQVDARIGLSRSHVRLEDFASGRREAEWAIAASHALGDPYRKSAALLTLGIALYDSSDADAAATVLERAVVPLAQLGQDELLAEARLYLGCAHGDLSREWLAMEELEKAGRIARELGERGLEAQALVSLGHVLSRIGEKQKALDSYYQAAPLIRDAGDPIGTISLYVGMGYLLFELGDSHGAEEFLDGALRLSEEVSFSTTETAARIHRARIHASRKEPDGALSNLLATLNLLERHGDRRMKSAVLGEIARAWAEKDDDARALESYSEAIALAREGGFEREEAELLNGVGALELTLGRSDAARARFLRALDLSRRTSSPFTESRALYNLGRLERDAGRLDEALAVTEEALHQVETLRASIGSRLLRVSYLASVYELHALHVELIMALDKHRPGAGWLDRAFIAAEQARARTLLESVAQTDAGGFGVPDPALADYRDRLERRIATGGDEPPLRCQRAVPPASEPSDLPRLLAELDRVEAVLESPHFAEARQPPEPVGLRELQQELLDDRTALLSYFLGERESYLWVVSRSRISVHYLPSRGRIESGARGIHALLAGRGRKAGESERARYQRLRRLDVEYWKAASELSELLLAPAVRELDVDRLVIVADGALNRIPFSALPRPGSGLEEGSIPMVTRYEMVRLPSATIWKALAARRRPPGAGAKKLAVLADPVLESQDPRLASRPTPSAGSVDPSPAMRNVPPEIAKLPRLLSARNEAKRILELVPEEERFEALGFEANVGMARSGALAEYEVVHFATHGLLNSEHPELSGIVLSLFDREGRAENGYLRLHDIYDLELPVRLVVLSACSTGLGAEIRGEGIIGLVGGFLSSGTEGVIASYWDVDDDATAELMTRFYRHLFLDGLSPSKSLQMAQTSMWRERRWLSPDLWGAFEFQGLGE